MKERDAGPGHLLGGAEPRVSLGSLIRDHQFEAFLCCNFLLLILKLSSYL